MVVETLLVVVAIIGLMAAMGVPSIVKALQKEGMRKAVSDVQDVFFSAREQAIVANKPGTYYLRYALAFDLYRDRTKDLAKAKAVIRDLISKSPSNDGHTTNAVDWLLYSSIDDNEFRNDLNLVLAARRQFAHLGALRDAVKSWVANARQNKDFAARANIAAQELAKSNADPLIAAWTAQVGNQHPPGEAIRDQLLQPATFNAMSDDAARMLLQTQSEWFRHYSPGNKRGENMRIYRQYAARFPLDFQVALWWLETTTDYGKPEDCKPAAQHLLKFVPERSAGDDWRIACCACERRFGWECGCERRCTE